MKAKVKEKREIAKGTLLVKFDLLGKEVKFKPGQFFFVTLLNMPYRDERGAQRHFSIVNPPQEKGVLVMATRLSDSAFKKSLAEIEIGSEVEIGMADGSFILPDKSSTPFVFIAGGIGITPFLSMLKYVQEERAGQKATLIYSNRNKESTAFLEELKEMSENNPDFNLVLTMTDDPGWTGEKRMIDASFLKDNVPDLKNSLYFVAGPPAMVEAAQKSLLETGVSKRSIKTDNFTGY